MVERFTPRSADTLIYEATIEDPKGLHAAVEDEHAALPARRANAQLLEFRCVEFVEELLYGHLRKSRKQ